MTATEGARRESVVVCKSPMVDGVSTLAAYARATSSVRHDTSSVLNTRMAYDLTINFINLNDPDIDELLLYFERTYVNGTYKGTTTQSNGLSLWRSSPIFPPYL
ncbi:Uncharacterized protein FWK35_00014463 [Aphis craccivora]|uniref:Uncharacterized protein n=1 Tax=Aphis craccivora TaxID=307492 RepID=A0A6G0YT20_APHCR|nr:Uncharacterized protein FWK35_00014463 [Aphis craccivora]